MNPTMKRLATTSFAMLLAGASASVLAQVGPAREAATPGTEQHREKMGNAIEHVNEAIKVVRQMEQTPGLGEQLKRVKGVFVVPDYGRAALGVGARGGAGVLLVRNGNTWSNPAFYNMGGISLGLQAGAEGGSIAFLLNDQKAINSFSQNNKFSLNAGAGLTIVNWSAKGMGTAGWGDITVWSDTEGLFAGATISVTDVDYDEEETSAYYKRQVAARDVLSGKVTNPHADTLRQALASAAGGNASSTMGASGTQGATGTGKDMTTNPEPKQTR